MRRASGWTVFLLATLASLGLLGPAMLDRLGESPEPRDLSSPPVATHENWVLAVEDGQVRVLFAPRDGARTAHVLVDGLHNGHAVDLVSAGAAHVGVDRLGYVWFRDVALEPGAHWRLASDGWVSAPFRLDPRVPER